MRVSGRPAASAAGFAVALALAGCGGPDGPKLVPVNGKVTLKDGRPVKFGHVILVPDVAKGNATKEVVQGTIRDGGYTLMTGVREGAPPGAYLVTIRAAAEVDERNPYFTEWLAHEKYTRPDSSGLTLEAIDNPPPGRYDFTLDPHPREKDMEKMKAAAAAAVKGVPTGGGK